MWMKFVDVDDFEIWNQSLHSHSTFKKYASDVVYGKTNTATKEQLWTGYSHTKTSNTYNVNMYEEIHSTMH